MSKRAHIGKSKMQTLPRKEVMLKEVDKARIDRLFEHNQAVNVTAKEKEPEMPPVTYSEEDIAHFKSKS